MRSYKWFFSAMSFATVVVLTETFIALELAPIVLLVPLPVLLFYSVSTLIAAVCVVALCTWLWGRLRFSTQTLLFCVVLVGWPAARLSYHVRQEVRNTATQRSAFSKLKELNAKEVDFGGRYNDGRNDFAVQRWLYHKALGFIAPKFAAPNELPYEVMYLKNVDLSDTAVTDADVDLLVATETVENLDLSRTSITEAGIQKLSKLKSLRELRLNDLGVSAETVGRLRADLPELAVLEH